MSESKVRPLVTIAIFAYNQERYIREAVESAFAQDYSPLEIILSDDFSSDNTFEIMRELVRNYNGSHIVRLNRNDENMGTFPHFLRVARKAQGRLMIVAAGDDISYPHRTKSIVLAWLAKNNVGCICSGYDEIDAVSNVKRRSVIPNGDKNTVWQYFLDKQPRQFCYGQSAAYSADFLSLLPSTSQRIYNEDMITTLVAHATGIGVHCIESSLLAYRKHESYSNRTIDKTTFRGSIISANTYANYASAQHEMVTYLRKIALDNLSSVLIDNILSFEYMAKLERKTYIECNAIKANLYKRLILLCNVQSFDEFKTVAPRIFGIYIYAAMRYFWLFVTRLIAKKGKPV